MTRQINLHNRVVNYTVRRSKRAKRLRLAVYCDGNFVVTLPKGISETQAERYIIQKSNWVLTKMDFFKNVSLKKTLKLTDDDYLKHKDKALTLAQERVDHYNKIYGYKYNAINIRNQKTRWGSCSRKKNLNFNFKIAFLPENLRDYIIVHELCHLKEFNHSQKFWNLVAKAMPEYKELIHDLRLNGLMLQ